MPINNTLCMLYLCIYVLRGAYKNVLRTFAFCSPKEGSWPRKDACGRGTTKPHLTMKQQCSNLEVKFQIIVTGNITNDGL